MAAPPSSGAQDDFGALTVHVDSNGCGSSVHWASLSGSSGGAGRISFVQLHVVACNRTGCSTGKNSVAFHNPFT